MFSFSTNTKPPKSAIAKQVDAILAVGADERLLYGLICRDANSRYCGRELSRSRCRFSLRCDFRLSRWALGIRRRCRGCCGLLWRPVRAGWRGSVAVDAGRCCARVNRQRDLKFLTQCGFKFVADVFVFLQEDAGVLAALAHALAAKADPRAVLLQQTFFYAEVDQITFA